MIIVQVIIKTEPMRPELFRSHTAAERRFTELAVNNGFEIPDIDGDTGLSTEDYELHIWFGAPVEVGL